MAALKRKHDEVSDAEGEYEIDPDYVPAAKVTSNDESPNWSPVTGGKYYDANGKRIPRKQTPEEKRAEATKYRKRQRKNNELGQGLERVKTNAQYEKAQLDAYFVSLKQQGKTQLPKSPNTNKAPVTAVNEQQVEPLLSTTRLTQEDLDIKNAGDMAELLSKQSHACLFKIMVAIQTNNPAKWNHVQRIVEKLASEEASSDAYAHDNFEGYDNDGYAPGLYYESDEDGMDGVGTNEPELYIRSEDGGLGEVPADTSMNAEKTMHDMTKAIEFHKGQRDHDYTMMLYSSTKLTVEQQWKMNEIQKIRAAGREKVHNLRKNIDIEGFRTPATIRHAFDVKMRHLHCPKGIWRSSDHWFIGTVNVINSDVKLCMLPFKRSTDTFLMELEQAMFKAITERLEDLEINRSFEGYADLAGGEYGAKFTDCFLVPIKPKQYGAA